MATTRVVLVGGGGHASDVLGVLEECNLRDRRYDVVAGLDDDPDSVDRVRFGARGVAYRAFRADSLDALDRTGLRFLSAIGYPASRLAMAERAVALGLEPLDPVIHPGAVWIATGVELGAGTVIHAGASVGVYARIGMHGYVSHGALVGHDSVLGDGAAVMPGASLSGGVRLGRGVMVGSGAVILEGLAVGDGARIGANAVVTKDVAAGATVVGIPAQPRTGG